MYAKSTLAQKVNEYYDSLFSFFLLHHHHYILEILVPINAIFISFCFQFFCFRSRFMIVDLKRMIYVIIVLI